MGTLLRPEDTPSRNDPNKTFTLKRLQPLAHGGRGHSVSAISAISPLGTINPLSSIRVKIAYRVADHGHMTTTHKDEGTDHTTATHPTWAEYNEDSASNDSLMAELEVRIIALEEALTSWRARRRLVRSIRKTSRAYQWTGSFYAARLESTTHEWLNGPRWRNEIR